MRVRPLRSTERRALTERRPHIFGRPSDAEETEPEAQPPGARAAEHPEEDRHREAVTPEDTAHYACSCGFQFQASVSTSVTCPHCGTGQAW